MVQDPYEALNLPHNATAKQIKTAYRIHALKYHPDRLVRKFAGREEKKIGSDKFASMSSAYALLKDDKRKKEYDHIYKFGGYDNQNSQTVEQRQSPPSPSVRTSNFKYGNHNDPLYRKHNSKGERAPQRGVGYEITDPFSYICSLGKQKSRTVAGIQIPSRLHLSGQPIAARLRFAFSSAEFVASSSGKKTYTSKNTQFVDGKKYTRSETTTVHPDGRKEIIIEGNDYIERRYCPPTRPSPVDDGVAENKENRHPWYTSVWNGLRESITMCHSPCIQVR